MYLSTSCDLLPILLFTFAPSGVWIGWRMFRRRLLEVVPWARDRVFDGIRGGVVLTDSLGRVVDMNPSAERILRNHPGLMSTRFLVQPAERALGAWPAWAALCTSPQQAHIEISVGADIEERRYEVHIYPLADNNSVWAGNLSILHDITNCRRAEEAMRISNEGLTDALATIAALRNQLLEQAIHDPITGLFNYRYLEESLEREFYRGMRDNYPVSLVLADIDLFRQLNDLHGHKAGDQVLRELGNLLSMNVRAGDIAGRYGGNEFLVMMPNAPLEVARRRAESWRKDFAALQIKSDTGAIIRATFSAGIASFPQAGGTADSVLRAADHALRHAKASGRNCISLYTSPGPGSEMEPLPPIT